MNKPKAIPAKVTCERASASKDRRLTTRNAPSSGAMIPIKIPVKNVCRKNSNCNKSCNISASVNHDHGQSIAQDVRIFLIIVLLKVRNIHWNDHGSAMFY